MQRTPVDSTAMRSVGYDRSAMTLEIEFPSGDVYQYLAVPEAIAFGLFRAASLGSYFNARIKDRYRSVRLY